MPATENAGQELYALINFFAKDQFIKKIHPDPNTKYYIDCRLCSTYPVDYIGEFLQRVSDNDTGKHYIDSADLVYFKSQIAAPSINFWESDRLQTARIKGRSNGSVSSLNQVSVPLLTRNGKSAVIFATFQGYTECYLYFRDDDSKRWDLVTVIWHDEDKFGMK